MMSWDEAKRFYWVTIFGYPIIIGLFVALLMQETLDLSGMISLALFGSLTVFGTALFAVLYGYHHRHEIGTGDEVPMDPNGLYWGAAAGAVAPLIIRRVESLFGG